jgi:hypothetical protein
VENESSATRTQAPQEGERILNVLEDIDAEHDVVGRRRRCCKVGIVEFDPIRLPLAAEGETLRADLEPVEPRGGIMRRELYCDLTGAASHLGDAAGGNPLRVDHPADLPGLPRRVLHVERGVLRLVLAA